MKKQILLRGLLGFPLGITIGYMFTIVISLIFGQGYYLPCVPQLVVQMGNEVNAVIFQTVLCGLLGVSFAASSVIWEIDAWSIAKQSGIYFAITAMVMFPIAYFANWMDHTVTGFLVYFGIFALIFLIVWVIQYLIWKEQIRKVNSGLK